MLMNVSRNDRQRTDLSLDEVCHLLQSRRRRDLLRYLADHDDPVPLSDVAEQMAAAENDSDPDQITPEQRKRVYISLYQNHIPQLEEAGIVEYDSDDATVVGRPPAQHLYEAIIRLQTVAADYADDEDESQGDAAVSGLCSRLKEWTTS